MGDQIPALIIAHPLVMAMVLPILALRSVRLARGLGFVVLAVTFALCGAALSQAVLGGPIHYRFGGWMPPWGIEYVIDPLNGLMLVLVSFFSLLGFAGLKHETYGWAATQQGIFSSLYMLMTAGLLGICVTGDMFNLYVFLEITALSGYALVSAGGDRGRVAAFRYLIVGSVAATFWVIGLGYLYAATGTLNMADMASLLPAVMDSRAVSAGLAFLVAGMGIKMALFPLHGWQPDAYSYAPASTIPVISAVMAKVSAYVIIRVLFTVFGGLGPAEAVLQGLAWIAALSIIAGSIMALRQTDIRRMLAYSSVAQIGYVAIGIGMGSALALTGAILHIVNHAVMKGGLFFMVAGIRKRTGKTDIRDFAGLGKLMPWTSAVFFLAAVSMIGLPPTCGFFSKLYLVTSAVQAEAWPFVAAFVASSLLNTVYFFRVIEQLYMGEAPKDAKPQEAPAEFLVPVLVLGALILLLGVFNQTVVAAVIGPAVSLIGGGG